MCLYTKQICPIRARKKIVCYKVVIRREHAGEKKYRTPCMEKSLRLHKLICPSPITLLNKIHKRDKYIGKGKWTTIYEVNGGWIHACNTLDDAKLWLKENYHFFDHNKTQPFGWAIIECVVHKGVLYYRSFDRHTLCAKKLFTRKIVLQG